MKEHAKKTGWFFQLRPRYVGSYAAMACGLSMVVFGHVQFRMVTSSLGEVVMYGAILYHARKRQRFGRSQPWLALEAYAGLSIIWMAVNILKIRVWQWHPLAFGLMPLLILGAYGVALTGKLSVGAKGDRVGTSGLRTRQIATVITVAAAWAFLNLYAFPRLGITT
jgi:hypothetical protein